MVNKFTMGIVKRKHLPSGHIQVSIMFVFKFIAKKNCLFFKNSTHTMIEKYSFLTQCMTVETIQYWRHG